MSEEEIEGFAETCVHCSVELVRLALPGAGVEPPAFFGGVASAQSNAVGVSHEVPLALTVRQLEDRAVLGAERPAGCLGHQHEVKYRYELC